MIMGAKTFRLIIVNRLHTRQQTLWAGRKNAAANEQKRRGVPTHSPRRFFRREAG